MKDFPENRFAAYCNTSISLWGSFCNTKIMEVFKLINKIKSTNELNIYLMYVIVFLQGFVFYGPVATLYRQARGLNLNQVFVIESVF